MNYNTLITIVAFFLVGINVTDAQRLERTKPLTIKDQILMKLDSIDQIYFSRLRTRDRFEAKKRLDGVAQLVDRLSDELRDKELALLERERALQKREWGIEEREKDRDRIGKRDKNREDGHDKEVDHVSPIGLQEFGQLVTSIERTPFDQDKKKIVGTSAMNNYFLVDQVIKLTSKFPFDNDRLDVIEMLYPRILDFDKNYLLYNCFTFSDSKNKLEKFMEENNRNGRQ